MAWVDVVGLVGVVATLYGLYLTWKQAKLASSRANAARAAAETAAVAVEQTQRTIKANQLMVLIPQLRAIAKELDDAIVGDSRDSTRRQLNNWREQAAYVIGAIDDEKGPGYSRLKRSLSSSTALAAMGVTRLMDDDGPVREACAQAREAIGKACDDLTTFVGKTALRADLAEMEIRDVQE